MTQSDYLDRTERFVTWVESKRKQAGLMQKELADLGGISHSYYTKLVSLRRARQRHGDESGKLTVPQTPNGLYRVLQTLSDRLGEDCMTEGLRLWEHSHRDEGNREDCTQGERKLVELFQKLLKLPKEKRELVDDLVNHLQ